MVICGTKLLAAVIAIAGLISSVFAGTGHYIERVEIIISVYSGEQDSAYSRIWVAENKLRNETGGEVIIARLDKEIVWLVNPSDKTYSEVKLSEMRQLYSMLLMMMGVQMDEEGKISVPDDLYRKTGRMMKVGEWNTEEIALSDKYAGDGFVQRFALWVSAEVDAPKDLYSDMMLMFFGDAGGEEKKLIKFWQEMGGFPVLTEIESAVMNSITRVVKVEKAEPPPELFEIPQGYKHIASFFEGMGGGR